MLDVNSQRDATEPGSAVKNNLLEHTATAAHSHVMMKCKIKIYFRVGLVCRLFLKLCVFHVFFFNLSFPVSSSRVGISTGFPIFSFGF
jgi:hypothetical protein